MMLRTGQRCSTRLVSPCAVLWCAVLWCAMVQVRELLQGVGVLEGRGVRLVHETEAVAARHLHYLRANAVFQPGRRVAMLKLGAGG